MEANIDSMVHRPCACPLLCSGLIPSSPLGSSHTAGHTSAPSTCLPQGLCTAKMLSPGTHVTLSFPSLQFLHKRNLSKDFPDHHIKVLTSLP